MAAVEPKRTRGVSLAPHVDEMLVEIAKHDCTSCSSVIERAVTREFERMKPSLLKKKNGDTKRKDSSH